MTTENNDRQLVEKLAAMSLRESQARRRWGVLFKSLLLCYVFVLTGLFIFDYPGDAEYGQEHVAIVPINGVIAAGGDNDSGQINEVLRQVFRNDSAKGVILQINSPGGSPVESNRIYNELRRLRGLYPNKKVYAVVGDICASGGYYIAAAADEIYVDENSIVGSIGVIWSGFGFVEAMKKLGVERRVQTAGGSKNLLDPFLPSNYDNEKLMSDILGVVHGNFIAAVKEGRGERLLGRADIFSGAIFSGEQSVELGLTDGIGDVGYVTREVIGIEHTAYYGVEEDIIDSVTKRLGVELSTLFHSSLR
ncbi:MAG: S49 family peptidase [Gammaproteobacteria bacterium WSBS_2016_MAG_OTU1]